MKTNRGFGLVGSIVSILVATVLITQGYKAWSNYSQRMRFEELTTIHAQEISILTEASEKYLIDNKAAIVATGGSQWVPSTDMMAGNYLPVTFGSRDGQTGKNPWGGNYGATYVVDPVDSSIVRTIVQDGFSYDWSITYPLGFSILDAQEAAGTMKIAMKTAKKLMRYHQLISGTIAAGETMAKGLDGSFSLDAAGMVSAYTRARPVVFVGWPELGQEQPGSPDDDNNLYRQCDFRPATSGCPAGWDDVVYLDACGKVPGGGPPYTPPAGADVMTSAAYSVPGTNFTLTLGSQSYTTGEGRCTDIHGNEVCTGRMNRRTEGLLSLNSGVVQNPVCSTASNRCNSSRTACQQYFNDSLLTTWRVFCCEPN